MTMRYKILSTTEVSDERVLDMICGAFEGGSNYWIDRVRAVQPLLPAGTGVVWYARPEFYADPNWCFRVWAQQDSKAGYHANSGCVYAALTKMAEDYPSDWADLINENDDANTHDLFMQLLVLGEVIYG